MVAVVVVGLLMPPLALEGLALLDKVLTVEMALLQVSAAAAAALGQLVYLMPLV